MSHSNLWKSAALAAIVLSACNPFHHKSKAKSAVDVKHVALGVTGAGKSLSRVTSDPVDELFPALSPNGKTLLVTARTGSDSVIVGVNPNSGSSRMVYTSQKATSGSPVWLPTGKSFVYVSNSMGTRSLVKALSNSPNAAISIVVNGDNAPDIDLPTLSPDGTKVSFQMTSRGTTTIGVAGLDGSNFTMLTEGSHPAWSPDGKQLAFVRPVGGVFQIFVVDAESGSELTQVTNGDASNATPTWSADGKLIAFSSNRGYDKFPDGSKDGTWNLYVVKQDGSGLTQLTDGSKQSDAPCWGSDGYIYFETNEDGNFDIWRFKPAIEG